MLGCEHYPRKCKLLADCCNTWVVCRHCHDQNNPEHIMTRFDTKRVLCMECNLEQPISNICLNSNCAIQFARYFCSKCKFFDDTPNKSIYHCNDCRICRVGKGLGYDYFHCKNCDSCISLQHEEEEEHPHCDKRPYHAACRMCKQYLHVSTKPVVIMNCGHAIHAHCNEEYTNTYKKCPRCPASPDNVTVHCNENDQAVTNTVPPDEITSIRTQTFCHDCGQLCETQLNYSYPKCSSCNSQSAHHNLTVDVSAQRTEEEPSTLYSPSANEYGISGLVEVDFFGNPSEDIETYTRSSGILDSAIGFTAAEQSALFYPNALKATDFPARSLEDFWKLDPETNEDGQGSNFVSDKGQCSSNNASTSEALLWNGTPLSPSKRHADNRFKARDGKRLRDGSSSKNIEHSKKDPV